MSEDQEKAESPKKPSNSSLEHIRTVAQSHLEEIYLEKETEQKRSSQAETDIMHYKKLNKKSKSKGEISPVRLPEEKGPKLRPATDVLDRLRWDPAFDLFEYHVGYLERFEGIIEMPASMWIHEFTDEEWIPQHRIKYVKRVSNGTEEVVWDRESRLDKIFGSGAERVDESVDGSVAGGVIL